MFIDIAGHRVFALSFGSGPRTFLAHSGWIGNYEDWIATLAVLSQTWRTVIYDHRGTGETKVPVEAISSEALRDDLFRVMDALKIDRCVLGGFSAGTSIALRAVIEQPNRFDGLVLLNGSGGIRRPGAVVPASHPPSTWPGANFGERMRWFAEQCTPEPDSEHIRRWAQHLLTRAGPEAAEKLWGIRFAQDIDLADHVKRLAVPTLLIHGAQDAFVQTASVEYLAALIPKSKLVILESTGHLAAMTRPDDVAAAINDFFAPQPMPAP